MERIELNRRAPAPTRAKAKFDDQIVAIAAVEGASLIYSDDKDIAKLVGGRLRVVSIAELPLPPEDAQGTLPLVGDRSDAEAADT